MTRVGVATLRGQRAPGESGLMNKEQILEEFKLFSLGTDGIGGWLSPATDKRVFERLAQIKGQPLSKVQLNQLLAFGHEAQVSADFFRYYWLSQPDQHPYNVAELQDFDQKWLQATSIQSLGHLRWGLRRLYTDALLYFGSVRTAYRRLRAFTEKELNAFFAKQRFDTDAIRARGPSLALDSIARDDRYLISEMACKSYAGDAEGASALKEALLGALKIHMSQGGGRIKIRRLLDPEFLTEKYKSRQQEFIFSADDVLEEAVASEEEIDERYRIIADRFVKARETALANTELYLSMVNDLDVYVATSMRTRQDFRNMAADCDAIFSDEQLKKIGYSLLRSNVERRRRTRR